GYGDLLAQIKERIRTAQLKASLAVNRGMIELYWDIGHDIVVRQEREGWGKKVIERLAHDLGREFPGVEGFSAGNLWRMRAFVLAYRSHDEILAQPARELGRVGKVTRAARGAEPSILPQAAAQTLPQPVAEIPWFHNVVL